MLFDKIALVYFIWKILLFFNIGNGQPREPALCQLYRRTVVPYVDQYTVRRYPDIFTASGRWKQHDVYLFCCFRCVFACSACLSIDSHSLPFTAGYFPFQLPFILNFIPIPKLGDSVALMLDSSRRAWVQIAAVTLSGNMLRQTVHTNCACVHRGPFCAWVQHSNHSATELLQTNKKTKKNLFFQCYS